MRVDVSSSIMIDRPLEEVARYSSDPDNVPAWYTNITSIVWETPPLRVGSRIAFVAHFLGRRLEYTYEIVEFASGKHLVMATADGPFPMETTYTWNAIADEQTQMTLRNRGRPAGFSRWMAPFMALAVRRANRKDLIRLKTLLEGR